MKLLLRFYDPIDGSIFYNHNDILELSPKSIRKSCGVVLQDGYIFSDTIERNIATGDEEIDYLFLPVGGGGLCSGLGTVFKANSPKTKII